MLLVDQNLDKFKNLGILNLFLGTCDGSVYVLLLLCFLLFKLFLKPSCASSTHSKTPILLIYFIAHSFTTKNQTSARKLAFSQIKTTVTHLLRSTNIAIAKCHLSLLRIMDRQSVTGERATYLARTSRLLLPTDRT